MTRSLVRAAALALLMGVPAAAMAEDLSIGMSTTPTTLDPHEDSNAPNNAVGRHIWDALVNLTATSANEPDLAESWEMVDETTWRFKLRQGVTFHDGSEFNADDVVASITRARDKPSQAFASYTRNIASVTAVDPYTVEIKTETPDPMLLNSVGRLRIISADCAAATVQEFDSGKCAVGTGPFVFKSFTPGDRVELARNENYYAGPSEWENVTLRFLPDDGARLASLLSQELDIIETLPADGMARVEGNDQLQVINGLSNRLVYMGVDVAREPSPFVTGTDGKNPLKDERVRRAMLMAINRDLIVERVMQKNGTVADQFVAEGYLGFSPAIKRVAYDPEGAKALLAEAGYPNGFGLTLHGPAGRYVKDSEVLQAVGQMLARVGIQASVEVMPWSMFSERSTNRDFSMYLSSWGVNSGEVSNPAISLIETRDADKGTGRYNSGGVSDPEIDALLDQVATLVDETARKPVLEQISDLTFDRLWILPLHFENVVLGARTGLTYEPRGDKYTLAYYVRSAQ